MNRSTRTGLLLLGCTLAPPLFAFQHGQQSGPPLNQQFPGPEGLANFRKIVSGEFTGNKTRDAVYMDGNNPELRVSPEFFATAISTGCPANDIAVLSGAITGKDVLVTVEAGGLKLYEYDRNCATPPWSITTVCDAASPWANAALVAVGDVNGDGCPDIVGVAANKRDLLYVYGDCDLTFPPTTTVVVNPTQVIHQLLLMNWTNTNDTFNTVEAVMFSNLGWAIREDNGVWRKSVSWTASLPHGTVMDVPGTGPDRLVVDAVFNGTDRLSINDETRTEGPYNLGALGVVAMAAGNFTAAPDVDIDLVLTTNTDLDLRIYENQSPLSTTFDFATPAKYQFGPSTRNPALNQTGPEGVAVGDFDSDGRLDIYAPAQGNPNPGPLGVYSSFTLIRPDSTWTEYLCEIVGGHYDFGDPPNGVPPTIRLTFEHPTKPRLQAEPNTGQVAELLILLYYCPGFGQPTALTPVVGHVDIPAIGHSEWTFELPLNYSVTSSTDFFAMVAYQRIALGGVTIDRLPALTGLIVPYPDMWIADHCKDTYSTVPFVGGPHEEPISASWDAGPTVPPTEAEEEPLEQPGGGG